MSKEDFMKFVENKVKTKTEKAEVNWDKQRDEWLGYLEELYNDIENFLSEYIISGKISINREKKIELVEEDIGAYSVYLMMIEIGDEVIKLEPIGTLLIGVKGRVDLKSRRGIIRLVLVNSVMKSIRDHVNVKVSIDGAPDNNKKTKSGGKEKIEWKWRIVTSLPDGQYLELNEENFLTALMEISNA